MASQVRIGAVRPATKEDVVAALSPMVRVDTNPIRLRESHHRVLRLAALGYQRKEIAEKTGYTPERITQITNSPLGQSEITRHRSELEERMYDRASEEDLEDRTVDLATLRFLKNQRRERIIEAYERGEPIPIKDESAIIADIEDRYGTPRKSTNVSAYVNLGSKLDEAIARSEAVTIDGKVAAE